MGTSKQATMESVARKAKGSLREDGILSLKVIVEVCENKSIILFPKTYKFYCLYFLYNVLILT